MQLSGGIRDDASLERALSTGCARVVIGTSALEDPAWCARAIAAHGERVAVGLDVRVVEDADGMARHRLAARGWTRDGGDLWATLDRLDRDGCARYVVTDVSKDGTLRGPNVELYRAVARATAAPVIASGGISSIDDLVVLAEAAAAGANLEGAIVGRRSTPAGSPCPRRWRQCGGPTGRRPTTLTSGRKAASPHRPRREGGGAPATTTSRVHTWRGARGAEPERSNRQQRPALRAT